ncbi:MAG TPA: hypothetical protein PK649_06035 [Vicingus sp.]|nr:hypothetical protein [Vicingus sp.]HRP59780.1 hypothetical protein [Vicingus sp.]
MNTIYKELHQEGTIVSKKMNYALGDRTGRTITKTTMDGAYRLTNGQFNLSGFDTHTMMWVAGIGLMMKDKSIKTIGLILLVVLVIFYFAGRE